MVEPPPTQIRIEVKSLVQFEHFLPEGRNFDKLVDLIYFYLGDLLEYEVRLLLPAHEAQPTKLGTFGRLGWTSWMGKNVEADMPTKRWDCRFHPAEH